MSPKNETRKTHWAFFGSSNFSVIVLDELERLGMLPNLIVTTPDKPRGRGLKIESGPVKAWAEKKQISTIAPASLKNSEVVLELKKLGTELGGKAFDGWDTFLVASYGKIVPPDIFNIPEKGTLNIHPSLLPKLRGPTPLESAILGEKETGVTIMKIDEKVDHGEILAQKIVPIGNGQDQIPEWPAYYADLEKILAVEGARLFAKTLPGWLDGSITGIAQEEILATFTKKFLGGGLRILLEDDEQPNLRKIRAFAGNRGVYYIQKHNDKEIRVIINRAKIVTNKITGGDELILERVTPEGKKEMNFEDFKRGLR